MRLVGPGSSTWARAWRRSSYDDAPSEKVPKDETSGRASAERALESHVAEGPRQSPQTRHHSWREVHAEPFVETHPPPDLDDAVTGALWRHRHREPRVGTESILKVRHRLGGGGAMLLPLVVAGSEAGHRFNRPGLDTSPGLVKLGPRAPAGLNG
jgi:hypothetical protein